MLDVKCEVSLVSDGSVAHFICWCWCTLLYQPYGKVSVAVYWEASDHIVLPSAHRLYGHCQKYQYPTENLGGIQKRMIGNAQFGKENYFHQGTK